MGQYLLWVEFECNNLYRFTIGMAPYVALGSRSRSLPTRCLETGDNKLLGPETVQEYFFDGGTHLNRML